MKTSLVVKLFGDSGYRRACASDEGKPAPFYVAPHTASGWNGKLREWQEPESVSVLSSRFHPKRGKVAEIRYIDDETIAALEAIDAERDQIARRLAELKRDEQSLLELAHLRGKPITVEEARQWTEGRKAKGGAP